MKLLLEGAAALGLDLGDRELGLFQRYYQELVEWNQRVNLTAVTGYEEVQVRHFVDSLSVVLAVPKEALKTARVVDVGSGAGLPGVPLQIVFPNSKVTLIEATAKKTAFLAHLKEALRLDNLTVTTGRAEELAHRGDLREGFDIVVSRGLAKLSVLAELMLPLCRVGGLAIAHKQHDVTGEAEEAQRAVAALGGRLARVVGVDLAALRHPAALVVLAKVAPTPSRYPRRPGMPAKRPL